MYKCATTYRIDGYAITIEATATYCLHELLPSFAPFQVEKVENPLFVLRLVESIPVEQTVEITRFEWERGENIISFCTEGGYHLSLLCPDKCMQAQMRIKDNECTEAIVELPIEKAAAAFALNNLLTMLYAFARLEQAPHGRIAFERSVHAFTLLLSSCSYLKLGVNMYSVIVGELAQAVAFTYSANASRVCSQQCGSFSGQWMRKFCATC